MQTKEILKILMISALVSSCALNSKNINHSIPKLLVNDLKDIEVEVEDKIEEEDQDLEQVEKNAKKITSKATHILGSAIISGKNKHYQKTYFLYGAEHLDLENYYFDIPVVYNKAVKKWIKYFLTRGRKHFVRYSKRSGRYAPMMGKILEVNGLPRDLIFLAMAESGFQNNAKSWAKAVGPWQFMSYTGKAYGLQIDWFLDERRDPIKATIAASKYLIKLFNDFEAWELAAAAYNAGEGKMGRAIRRYRTENFWNISRGRYLKPETKNYVPKIMALAIIGKNLKSFGFENLEFYAPLDFTEITVGPMTDLMEVASAIGTPFSEIRKLNPEVLRWFTPPNIKEYKLRIPVDKKSVWDTYCLGGDFTAVKFQRHTVKGRRTRLRDVAKYYKIKQKNVLEILNGKSYSSRIKRGESIIIPFRKGQNKKAAMYADLYERPRKSIRRRRAYKKRIKLALRRGTKITNPSRFYVVRKGDTLWDVARKNSLTLDTLIASNIKIVKNRMIRVGDKLVVQ